MIPSPKVLHIGLRIPYAETEQEFLRLSIQAAIRKYRETRNNPITLPQTANDETYSLQVNLP
jgi:hypothetical protein